MACTCLNDEGYPRNSCLGTCKKQLTIAAHSKPYQLLREKMDYKFAIKVPSVYAFEDGLKLIGYDQELKNCIKYNLNKQLVFRTMRDFTQRACMARFYVEGDEIDVSDPAIHYTVEKASEDKDAIITYLFSVTENAN